MTVADLAPADNDEGRARASHLRWTFGSFALTNYAAATFRWSLPMIALQSGADAIGIGALRAAFVLPNVVLGVLIGATVDAYPRKTVVTSFLLTSVVLSLAAAAVVPHLSASAASVAIIVVFGAGLAATSYAIYTCQVVAIRAVCDSRKMTQAMGTSAFIERLCAIVCPVSSGAMLGYHLAAGPVLLCGVIYIGTLALVLAEPLQRSDASQARRTIKGGIAEAARLLRVDPVLRALSLAVCASNVVIAVFELALLVKLRTEMHIGAVETGAIYSACAAVGIVSTVVTDVLARWVGTRRFLAAASATCALAFVLLAVSANVVVVTCGCIALTGSAGCFAVVIASLRQRATPVEAAGAVTGATSTFFKLLVIPASLIAGFAAVKTSTAPLFAFCALLAAVGIVCMPRVIGVAAER